MTYLSHTGNVVFILLSWTLMMRNHHCSAFLSVRTILGQHAAISSFRLERPTARLSVRYYTNSTVSDEDRHVLERFQREAAKKKELDEECILTIHGNQYNMTAWANAHPGKKAVIVFEWSNPFFVVPHHLTNLSSKVGPKFFSSSIIEMPPRRLKGHTTPPMPMLC